MVGVELAVTRLAVVAPADANPDVERAFGAGGSVERTLYDSLGDLRRSLASQPFDTPALEAALVEVSQVRLTDRIQAG